MSLHAVRLSGRPLVVLLLLTVAATLGALRPRDTFAQDATGRSLAGQVIDTQSGQPVAQARVRTIGAARGDTRETVTGSRAFRHRCA